MSDLIGRTLGKYRLEDQLGAGGMALVFRSYHPQFHRPMAIKILPPTVGRDPGFRARFEREGRMIASLNHPNIVRVYDIDEHDGLFYMVMDLLPGGTLEDRLREGGLDRAWSANVVVRMAEALEYAHVRGVIHRDIKPSNILLDAEGQPVLADFGIAKLVQGDGDAGLTSAGMVMGTPAYMAPEQLTGEQPDARADIYSLGIVLYQLLAGRAPFTGDTTAIVSAHLTRQPPALRDYAPDLPAALDAVVLQALAKQPEHRFKSAGVFAQALRNAAEDLAPSIVRVASAARSGAAPAIGPTLPARAAVAEPLAAPAASTLGQRVTRYLPIILGVLGLLLLISLLAKYWTLVALLLILLAGGGFAFIYFRARSAGRKAAAATTRAITSSTIRAAGAPAVTAKLPPDPTPPPQSAAPTAPPALAPTEMVGQPAPPAPTEAVAPSNTTDLAPTEMVGQAGAGDFAPTEMVGQSAPPASTEAVGMPGAGDLAATEMVARPETRDLTEMVAQPGAGDPSPTELVAQPDQDDVPEVPLPEPSAPTEAVEMSGAGGLAPTEAVPLSDERAPDAPPTSD